MFTTRRASCAGAPLPQSVIDALSQMDEQVQSEMSALQERRKQLHIDKKANTKAIRLKKKRDDRLLAKASRNLAPEALLEIAAKKMRDRQRKERGTSSSGSR